MQMDLSISLLDVFFHKLSTFREQSDIECVGKAYNSGNNIKIEFRQKRMGIRFFDCGADNELMTYYLIKKKSFVLNSF